MNNQLAVSSSPHILDTRTTRSIMLDVLIAMLPAAAASVYLFGLRSALLIAVCVGACVGFEALFCVLMKRKVPVGDLSAAVTGVLIAFNVPSTLPIWMAVFGCLVAIVVVKQLFGGLGCNFVNPALAARVVMNLSFTSAMTDFAPAKGAVDGLSAATPLTYLYGADAAASATATASATASATGHAAFSASDIALRDLFFGVHCGVLGETCCAALLLGFVYLLVRRVISPIIPVAYIGSMFLFSWAFGCETPLLATLSGGLFLGAIFMATDYVTSPFTNLGKLVFGIGCGLLTAVIRTWAAAPEGASYAILLMNLLVPYINDLTRRRPFGAAKGGAKA